MVQASHDNVAPQILHLLLGKLSATGRCQMVFLGNLHDVKPGDNSKMMPHPEWIFDSQVVVIAMLGTAECCHKNYVTPCLCNLQLYLY